jgi:hypothetical protein
MRRRHCAARAPWFLNLPLYIRANLAVQLRDPDTAIEYVRESLMCSRALHDKFAFVYALTPLAAAAALKGHDAWAASVLGTRDAVTEQTGASAVDKTVRELRERTERRSGSDSALNAGPRPTPRADAPPSIHCWKTSIARRRNNPPGPLITYVRGPQ